MAMPSESAPKSLTALGRIPSVGRIQDLLGLGTAPIEVKNNFRDITKDWRKSNTTSDGQPATELLDWNSPVVQNGLRKLAVDFLAEKDNAERFWSATRPWRYESKLKYPNDKDRIIELLVQLFFKQNRYKKTNATYGAWSHKDESESSREGSTPQRMTSIDTTSGKGARKTSQQRRQSEAAQNSAAMNSNFIDLSGTFGGSLPLGSHHNPLPPRNIYDVPDDQEPVTYTQHHPFHVSGLPNTAWKHSRSTESGETRPPQKRAKYSLRDRKQQQNADDMSDTEFEELIRRIQGESDCDSDSDSYLDSPPKINQQNTQGAPIAPMLDRPTPQPTIDQAGRRISSTGSDQSPPKDKSNAQPASGASPQMPPPPRPSQATLHSPQHRPKQHRVILKISNGSSRPDSLMANALTINSDSSTASTPSITNPEVQTKTPPVLTFSESNPQMGDTSKSQHQPLISSIPAPQSNGTARASNDPRQPDASSSNPSPQRCNYQKPSVSDPSVEAHDSISSPQKSTNEQIENENRGLASTLSEKVAAPVPLTSTSADTQAKVPPLDTPSNKPRPKATMNFWIITREPRDTCSTWPEGKIQGTSLSDFISGVAKATQRDATSIEKLELMLKTATSDTKVHVFRDDEDSWLVAKRRFTERLKEARANAKAKGLNENASPEIYVEPFYEQAGEVEVEVEEDDDLSFF